MKLCYGILSTSSIAPRFIAALRESGTGRVVALSSRTAEKAQDKARQWDIPTAYGSHAELLQDETVNIVYISNVNTAHYPWAKKALLAGKLETYGEDTSHINAKCPGCIFNQCSICSEDTS